MKYPSGPREPWRAELRFATGLAERPADMRGLSYVKRLAAVLRTAATVLKRSGDERPSIQVCAV